MNTILLKLLEQALAVEEQLHRASNAGLHQNPSDGVMQLHSRSVSVVCNTCSLLSLILLFCRFTDLDCLADGHQMLVKDCVTGSKNAIMLLRKGNFVYIT